jgi:hypothetical protein
MFYRRKIILALLQKVGGSLDKIRLQKLLFLFTLKQAKPAYEFVPYRFGCYSFSAQADLKTMLTKNLLAEDESTFFKRDQTDYLKQLTPSDHTILNQTISEFGGMNAAALMKYTYLDYPFYAIRSEVAGSLLSPEELDKIDVARPKSHKTVLFTIGYEGISLEEYLVRLLKNDVKTLVDVRNNPLSMKFGFSKSQLTKHCANLGIQYVHFPELGILSEQRQMLDTQTDYDKLFESYRKNNLLQTTQSQIEVLILLKQHKRIALTCFESNIHQCHRMPLAEAISKLPGFTYEVKHI